MLVLVEGESDAEAVRALAQLANCDLSAAGIEVRSANGVTNFSKVLAEFVGERPNEGICGLYDASEERYVYLALERAGYSLERDQTPRLHRFYSCELDLEDELIRALGSNTVFEVLRSEGDLGSFRRFQAMPQHRDSTTEAQLHRFLGTRATRKIRCARLLTQRLALDRLPKPFMELLAALCQESSLRHGTSDA